ncbi:MAG: methyltransferase domain-containing protein [Anaerolineae bacterium]
MGLPAYEIIERDDGLVNIGGGPSFYFRGPDEWPPHQREALSHARGRVLDIGCGAGSHALYLQERGLSVTGIDVSPLAIEVCRQRGLRHAEVCPVTAVSRKLGTFDTIIMMGNNLGLLGQPRRARWLLRRFKAITSDDGIIIGESTDPYQTTAPEHLAYHERNRRRGRLSGHLRIRVRYKTLKSPWFDYVLLSPSELKEIISGTGWAIRDIIQGEGGRYCAILGKAN